MSYEDLFGKGTNPIHKGPTPMSSFPPVTLILIINLTEKHLDW
jgi:hypothetical protein